MYDRHSTAQLTRLASGWTMLTFGDESIGQ
jgi:hypothetical protein